MNRRLSTSLCASLGVFALALAIGCGKYGKPERISHEPKAAATSLAPDLDADLDADEEPKRDKPNKP